MLNIILLQDVQGTTHGAGSTLMWVAFIALSVISMIVSKSVERKFKKYSNIRMNHGLTGREVAEQMLLDHDIHDVKIQMVNGMLTDHYNPSKKTLNLSPDVYNGTSVAAAAVAAHECGHAVQHATMYSPLVLRTALVPVVQFCSRFSTWVLLAGLLLIRVFPSLLLVGIAMFAASTVFSLVTLPVEVNASSRALKWMQMKEITSPETHRYAVSALRSAAYTYFMAAITSLATLLYYVMIYLDRR
jgi:Zn-dependent membrane protease YugP